MVVKNSFLRPSLSVSQPKKSAPTTAPDRYALPARPTSVSEKRNAGVSLQRARDRSRQRDLEPVENPGDAERRHDEP